MPGLVAVLLLQHNGKALVLLKQGLLNSMYVDGSLLQAMLSAGSGAKFTQGEFILYHELKLEVFR
ncbi:hypothetical protein ABB40_04680 [Lacticaseibacillus paracasei]|uniref:Uncharacterized protein n=1 Tax=Lacticaseibacillus paracasei subsp. paracasei TaxID=47714 RepID=A0AAP9HJY5_LACPA|nr:hypothetical protein ABB40_04680 [Lacticaseibacillus paracasei]QGV19179.1 Hypothetical protein LCAKO_2674 [Lacticaseibacillus paracasei subsp. paracasei]